MEFVEVDVSVYTERRNIGNLVVLFTDAVSDAQVLKIITEIAETADHDLNLPTFAEVLNRTVKVTEAGRIIGIGDADYSTYTVEHMA
jgi:hypothetical protein